MLRANPLAILGLAGLALVAVGLLPGLQASARGRPRWLAGLPRPPDLTDLCVMRR
jgi:hypothetical protein